jgi:hypothetical protein
MDEAVPDRLRALAEHEIKEREFGYRRFGSTRLETRNL